MEYESLESHIDCQLADLPESIRHAMSPIRKMLWDGLRPEGRIPLAIEHDCQNNPALASGREAIAKSAYEETGLNGTPIDWRYWVHQIPLLSAAEAARLMSALDPVKFCNLANRPGTDDPSEHCKKAEKIQRLAEREGMVEATPSAWIAWTNERRILVHAGFRIEVECLNLEPPHSPAQHTGTPAPVVPASDYYTLADVAQAIAAQQGWHDGARDTLTKQMMQAASDGTLPVRHPHTDLPYAPETRRDFYELVTPADVNAWLEKQGAPYRLNVAAPAPKAGAAVPAGAPETPEQGLTTSEIAYAFYDVCEWPAERWIKNLSAAKWAKPALIGLGEQGGAPSVWRPITLAQLIHGRAKAGKAKSDTLTLLHTRFNRQAALVPWRDAFNEFFATFSDAD